MAPVAGERLDGACAPLLAVLHHHPVVVGTGPVSFADVVAVARHGAAVELDADAWPPSTGPAPWSTTLAAAPTPAYGISTGFGALATRHIPTEMRAQLQRSLVRSHAAGSGPRSSARWCAR